MQLETRLLRIKEVTHRTGISRTTIWMKVRDGSFPRPVRIGSHFTAWPSHEIDAWIAEQIQIRDQQAAGRAA